MGGWTSGRIEEKKIFSLLFVWLGMEKWVDGKNEFEWSYSYALVKECLIKKKWQITTHTHTHTHTHKRKSNHPNLFKNKNKNNIPKKEEAMLLLGEKKKERKKEAPGPRK